MNGLAVGSAKSLITSPQSMAEKNFDKNILKYCLEHLGSTAMDPVVSTCI